MSSLSSKLVIQLVILIVALTPTWLFLLARAMLGPSGFVENLLMVIIGWLVLGSTQLVCLFFAGILSLSMWADP
jgi:hypothetical protein